MMNARRPLRRPTILSLFLLAALPFSNVVRADDGVKVPRLPSELPDDPPTCHTPTEKQDDLLDLRLELLFDREKYAEAFALIEAEYQKDPRPHVKARYGEYLTLADIYRRGIGVAQDLEKAETWSIRLAGIGRPQTLGWLASDYEKGTASRPPDLSKAIELYHRAALHGDPDSIAALRRLEKAGDPAAQRALLHFLLFHVVLGEGRPTPTIKRALKDAEKHYPDDPEMLLVRGRWHAYRGSGRRERSKGFALIERAAELGQPTAAAELATLTIEGIGTRRDPARGAGALVHSLCLLAGRTQAASAAG